MKHTPGPWGVAPNRKQVLAPHVIQRDNVLVRKLSGATPEQVEANARLIAAAPELFEALEEVAALFCPDSLPHEVVRAVSLARTTIAKATL